MRHQSSQAREREALPGTRPRQPTPEYYSCDRLGRHLQASGAAKTREERSPNVPLALRQPTTATHLRPRHAVLDELHDDSKIARALRHGMPFINAQNSGFREAVSELCLQYRRDYQVAFCNKMQRR
jgi:hypothetical protein